MTTRNRWIAAAVALLVALAGYFVSSQKHARIDRLSRDCATIARRKDWPRLEELAREWTALESSPLAWFWLGSALKEQQEWSEAEEAFSHVPVDGLRGIDAAIARMEIVYHIDQRPLAAIELARDLLQRDAGLAAPRRHLIHFYAMTMQRPELTREIRLAIKHRADVPEHYLYLFSVEDLSFRDAEQVTARWV
ncbi:MAG: hypothetical protein HY290_03725, partial [Planctomycetia bacterium]|nr:hypothetical protein [Planctomycetia bacterium]